MVQRWSHRLADAKNLFVAGAGSAYALGYLARALHAWSEQLGVLPALDFQYFVAGTLLMLPLAALVSLVLLVHRWLRRLAEYEQLHPPLAARIDRVLGVTVMGGAVLLGAVSTLARWTGLDLNIAARLVGVVLLVGFIGWFWLAMVRDSLKSDTLVVAPGGLARATLLPESPAQAGGWLSRGMHAFSSAIAWLWGALVLSYIALVALLLVVTALLSGLLLLPWLPQELGGAKPVCVQLDIETKALSPQLAALLFEPLDAAAAQSAPTRRTRPLALHQAGGDVLLLRLPAASPGRGAVLEVRRAVVGASTRCDDRLIAPRGIAAG